MASKEAGLQGSASFYFLLFIEVLQKIFRKYWTKA